LYVRRYTLLAGTHAQRYAAVACGAKVVVAFLDGQHGAQDLIAGLAPLCDEGAVCDLLSAKPVKLRGMRQQQQTNKVAGSARSTRKLSA
jgi:hypothetical protein